MRQLTSEQAKALHDGGEWKDWTLKEVGEFQLYQQYLGVPFDLFHEAIEHILDRSVWTHEFADQKSLQAEYEGKADKPGLNAVVQKLIDMVGEDKVIIVKAD